LKALLRLGISYHEFYGVVIYKLRKYLDVVTLKHNVLKLNVLKDLRKRGYDPDI